MNTDFMIGDIVKSLSGHDKNRLFIIVSIDIYKLWKSRNLRI